ncbi:MAG: hypothetical protein CVT99_02130 [Bacteroidetes bacterium HGW-Bacteroidetes-16]|jgi:hypothetical protein|nr:MAG: hypothetical protein CVT99_02130 [Bacteroidetes bacterium HGW-Bacteroidetes-16]
MSEIILTTKAELRTELLSVLVEYNNNRKENLPPRLFTINQVAKMFGKAHVTIKKLVGNGTIRSTKSGLIPEDAISDYLNI